MSLTDTPDLEALRLPAGLYIHAPFCSRLCHYCDFAKTARYDRQLVGEFFHRMEADLSMWIGALVASPAERLQSCFLGGGTPGLFCEEWANALHTMQPYFKDDAEITIELNPDNVTRERLLRWQELGINRFSIGVQTFSQTGLRALTRAHTPEDALAAAELCGALGLNYNLDMIYGWPGQTLNDWQQDLRALEKLRPPHLSLYALIFEPSTPFGRAARGGRIQRADEELYFAMYEAARVSLGQQGYQHEEVSNWSLEGASCKHNWLYWTNATYLGIGPGAHSHLLDAHGNPLRFGHTKIPLRYISHQCQTIAQLLGNSALTAIVETSGEDQLVDQVLTSIRTHLGVPIARLERNFDKTWQPNAVLTRGIDSGLCTYADGFLRLMPGEWFRETAWASEVLASFGKPVR